MDIPKTHGPRHALKKISTMNQHVSRRNVDGTCSIDVHAPYCGPDINGKYTGGEYLYTLPSFKGTPEMKSDEICSINVCAPYCGPDNYETSKEGK